MAWYAVKIIIDCIVEGEQSLCDEQLRVIEAPDLSRAVAEANRFGALEEHAYLNAEGREVRWTFAGLADVDELLVNAIESGVEVASTLHAGVPGAELVQPTEKFTATWVERHRRMKAGDLLPTKLRPYAPK